MVDDKAIFGYGNNGSHISMSNLVSNSGVVAADVTGVGTARRLLASTSYGSDKAIFAYGDSAGALSMSNLVSSSGVVASDTTGVGTARSNLAGRQDIQQVHKINNNNNRNNNSNSLNFVIMKRWYFLIVSWLKA